MARWWTNCSLVTGFSGPRVRAFRKQLNKSERNPCFPDSKVPPGMPGCCVPLCTNSFKKGYIMAQFPRDPSRRQIWASYVWRDDWTPTDASTICETHFSAEMWERGRADGKRKLKPNAVPTLFNHYEMVSLNTEDCQPVSVPLKVKNSQSVSEREQDAVNILDSNRKPEVCGASLSTVMVSNSPHSSASSDDKKWRKRCQRLEILKEKETVSNNMRKQNIKYYREIQLLQSELSLCSKTNISRRMLHKVFAADQIRTLELNKRQQKWSNITSKKALQLKLSCGNTGYEMLLSQNQPLPSVRTLRRRLKSLRLQGDISKKIFHLLKTEVDQFADERDKETVLVLAEKSVVSRIKFDNGGKTSVGNVT